LYTVVELIDSFVSLDKFQACVIQHRYSLIKTVLILVV